MRKRKESPEKQIGFWKINFKGSWTECSVFLIHLMSNRSTLYHNNLYNLGFIIYPTHLKNHIRFIYNF